MKKKKKLRLKRPFQLILAALLFLLAFSFFQLIKNQFKQENPLVSTQVLNYEDLMLKYARENDIEEYLGLLQAMMMQESGGQGNDPMQSSECEFNTQFEKKPNAISDPEYSIQVGIRYFAKCLEKANVSSLKDEKGIFLALQSYNYGIGYMNYVEQTDKQYTHCLQAKGQGVTIRSFFHLAGQAGIPLSPVEEQHLSILPNIQNGKTGK